MQRCSSMLAQVARTHGQSQRATVRTQHLRRQLFTRQLSYAQVVQYENDEEWEAEFTAKCAGIRSDLGHEDSARQLRSIIQSGLLNFTGAPPLCCNKNRMTRAIIFGMTHEPSPRIHIATYFCNRPAAESQTIFPCTQVSNSECSVRTGTQHNSFFFANIDFWLHTRPSWVPVSGSASRSSTICSPVQSLH